MDVRMVDDCTSTSKFLIRRKSVIVSTCARNQSYFLLEHLSTG